MDQKPGIWNKKATEKTLVCDKAYNSLNKNGDDAAEVQEFMALKGELERNLTRLSAALSDYNSMETFIEKQVKIAQEAIAGWEKAKTEAISLKKDLHKVLQQKAASEDRSNQLEAALKDCTQQLQFVREDQEKRIQTAVVRALEEFDKTRVALELSLGEAGKRIVMIDSDNTQLKKALSGKDKIIQELSEYRAHVESDFNALTQRVDSTEKENASLKYEIRVLEKELDIRNEEAEFNRQAADVAQKKYKGSVQKVTNLESECQRLRSLVQKRLPGPAALTKMRNEVEMLGRDRVGSRRRKSPSLCGSADFPPDTVSDTPSKRIGFLTEQLNAMEEENRTLRNALNKRLSELQVSRNMYVRAASRLSRGEESVKGSLQERSVSTFSDAGSEDKASCAESWASALISELENFKNEKPLGTPTHGNMGGLEMYLMDDFVEMEKFAVDSVGPGCSGHSSEEGNVIVAPSGEDSNGKESANDGLDSHVFPTSGKSSNSDRYDTRDNNSKDDDMSSIWIHKFVKILEEISKCVAESFIEKDDKVLIPCKNMEVDSAGYFVRVVKWKAAELSDILQQSLWTCNDLLNGEDKLAQFAELVATHLDWAVNHCFPVQDFSSMEEEESSEIDNESSNERELSYLPTLEHNNMEEAKRSIDKSSVAYFNGTVWSENDKNESCGARLQDSEDITEKLPLARQSEPESDQIENQMMQKDLHSSKLYNTQNMQQLKSMTTKEAPDDGPLSKTQLQNDQEITAASKRLAECQETILNLEKQFKALASPIDAAIFNKVVSTPADPAVISRPTSQGSSGKRLSLLDNMLAEDNDHIPIPADQTRAESLKEFTHDPNNIDGDEGRHAVCSTAIVPAKKIGGKSFLKKLFRWHKRGKSKKTPPFTS